MSRPKLASALLAACDDPQLFGFDLWPKQRDLLAAIDAGPRIHVWALGRRSGKTTLAALVCLWNLLLSPRLDEMVRPGETRFAICVAVNHAQARLLVSAARSIVERSPVLCELVEDFTEDAIRFRTPSGARVALRAFACNSRGGRGWPVSCLVMDEAAHFISDTEGPQVADRVWAAMVPSTAQFGDAARVLALSTPFGRSGLFADLHSRAADSPDMAAAHFTTADMNPTIGAEFLATEEARDPESFKAEYLAEFQSAGNAYIDFDRVETGAAEATPDMATGWVCGLDPAFSRDPFGVALVGRSKATAGQLVIGPVRAYKPMGEFGVIDEIAALAATYRARVTTDQFSAAAVVDRFRHHGLGVKVHTMTATSKTAIFSELRARLYDRSLVLPDNPALVAELQRLQTRFSVGSAAVTNPRLGGSHGDQAQALALAVWEIRHGSQVRVTSYRPDEPDDLEIRLGGLTFTGPKYVDADERRPEVLDQIGAQGVRLAAHYREQQETERRRPARRDWRDRPGF